MALDLLLVDDDAGLYPEALLRPIRYPPTPPTPAQLRQTMRDFALTRDATASVMGVALVTLIRYLRPPTSKQNRPIPRIRFQALQIHVERMRQEQEADAAASFCRTRFVIPSPEPLPVAVSVALAVPDDRRTCMQCAGRKPIGGLCLAARHGLLPRHDRNFVPDTAVLHRCSQYTPGRDDPDRRPSGERWPMWDRTNGPSGIEPMAGMGATQ